MNLREMAQKKEEEEIGTVEGNITSLSSRNGATNGRSWTIVIATINGEEYSGFKGSVAGLETLKEGEEVKIIYKKKGQYKNILEINPSKITEELLSPETLAKIKVVEDMMEKNGKNASDFTEEENKSIWEKW